MTRHLLFIIFSLFFFSCAKESVNPISTTPTPTPTTPVVKGPDPIFKNYLQPSYFLRKSDVWPDFYKIASSNGINVQNLFYDCPEVLADFNGDGYDDILMVPAYNPNQNKRAPLELYLNDKSNNKFILDNSLLKLNLGANNARKGIVGDFNKDGKPDVVYCESGVDSPPFPSSEQSILLSGETGYTMNLISTEKWFGHGVTSGDFDNDGDLDLFFTNHFKPRDYLYLNDGKGNFILRDDLIKFRSEGIYTCEFYDINKDGFLDLFVGGANDYQYVKGNQPIKIMLGNGKDFDDSRTIVLPSIFKWDFVMDFNFIDVDKDGKEEIILNRTQDTSGNEYNGYRIQILKLVDGKYNDVTDNLMKDYFSEKAKWFPWIRVEDIDKNGKLDIFNSDKGYYNSGQSIRWEQDTDGVFKKK
jgi:hypothetical protein